MPSENDRRILRSLAARVREIAELPEMAERRRRWRRHNALDPERPLVLCFPEGAWEELLPGSDLRCEDEKLRGWEWDLRAKIYWWEHIHDDAALDPWFPVRWAVEIGGYGVDIPYTHGENRGSYVWDAPLKDLPADLDRLRFRPIKVDREATRHDLDLAADLFGDLLPPRLRGGFLWTMGLTQEAIKLVGLERLMLLMVDDPESVHRLMAWLRDEHRHLVETLEREGLLTLNNEGDYVGSGGLGYTDGLPQPGRRPGDAVRLEDLWGFAESQETVGVSPAMFGEFVFPYQLPLLEKFGLNCYGCCEGVHTRMEYIARIPNLRRISVSPWCDQRIMAEKLGRNYIFSRKPNPSLVCVDFDEEAIRRDLAETLRLAGGGVLEIIMKDTHTVQRDPTRLSRWVRIALEEVEKYLG